MQVRLINGTTISLKGADRPETMRGVSLKFLVLDEYADMKPDVWELILRPALTDLKGDALFIGTPMGRNHFYELYKQASLGEDPTYKAWHYTSYDNDLLDKEEIDAAKKSMSSFAFRQEFMASFEARGSEMFKEEWLQTGTKPTGDGDYYIAIEEKPITLFEHNGDEADAVLSLVDFENFSLSVYKQRNSDRYSRNSLGLLVSIFIYFHLIKSVILDNKYRKFLIITFIN